MLPLPPETLAVKFPDCPTLSAVGPEIETWRLPPPLGIVDIVTFCVVTPGPVEGTVSRKKQFDAHAVDGLKVTAVLALPDV